MVKLPSFQPFGLSLLLHCLALAALLGIFRPAINVDLESTRSILIEIRDIPFGPSAGLAGSRTGAQNERPALDLAPRFFEPSPLARSGSDEPQREKPPGFYPSDEGLRYRNQQLHTQGKIIRAFDQLAARINRHLKYPDLLAEKGVEGMATLDLYFDSEGRVDEGRSRVSGSGGLLRGLMIRSARNGLVDWYRHDAFRLNKDQFRNQHFRADFLLSYVQGQTSALEQSKTGAYRFVRTRFVPTCLQPGGPGAIGLDLACGAVKVAGWVKKGASETYASRLIALEDQLEHYDRIGLQGIRKRIDVSLGG